MIWEVHFDRAFNSEFDALPSEVQDELLAHAKLLEEFGPTLGRPRVDTLNGSRHANMKELRFRSAGGVWRVAFAFDPQRQIRWQPETLLQGVDCEGRRPVRQALGPDAV